MKNYKQVKIVFILLIFCIFVSCSKSKSDYEKGEEKEETALTEKSRQTTRGTEEIASGKKPASSKKSKRKELDQVFLKKMEFAESRMLEYIINVTYESDDFPGSRRNLLTIIADNGFIKSNSSSTGGDYSYLNSSFFVKIDNLYGVLKQFDTLGRLKSESIEVKDHTPNMMWQKIKIDRENLRMLRKNKTITQVSAARKTWTERELSLERSENELDKARFEEWKLNDKIKWARINFYLQGPTLSKGIHVPVYKNAFIDIYNGLLQIVYGLIYIIPVIIIFLPFWIKRKAIKRFLNTKGK